jgi:hypothetical protein
MNKICPNGNIAGCFKDFLIGLHKMANIIYDKNRRKMDNALRTAAE